MSSWRKVVEIVVHTSLRGVYYEVTDELMVRGTYDVTAWLVVGYQAYLSCQWSRPAKGSTVLLSFHILNAVEPSWRMPHGLKAEAIEQNTGLTAIINLFLVVFRPSPRDIAVNFSGCRI